MKFNYHFQSTNVNEKQFASSATKIQITVAVPESSEATAVHAFETETELQTWLKTNKLLDTYNQMQKKSSELQKFMNLDNAAAMRRQQLLQERIGADLQELSQRLKLKPDSLELLQKAALGTELVPAILKSLVLNDEVNHQGKSLFQPSGLPIPDYGWFKFDNKASSLRLTSGIVAAYDRSWWRGARFYAIASNGPLQIPNLASVFWDNKFESSLHF